MRERRDYWSRHIEAWRQSGQSRKAYCEEHGLSYWSMRDWIRKLTESAAPAAPPSQRLVELEPVGGGAEHGGERAPIEVAVGDRYVLRLWPHLRAEQLREVLAILEGSR